MNDGLTVKERTVSLLIIERSMLDLNLVCESTHVHVLLTAQKGRFGKSRNYSLALLTSLNYLHMPICHPDHEQGT